MNPIVVMLGAALFLIGIAYLGSLQRRRETEALQKRARELGVDIGNGIDDFEGEPDSMSESGESSDEDDDDVPGEDDELEGARLQSKKDQ